MRRSDEMDEGIGRRDLPAPAGRVERVAKDDFSAGGQPMFRAWAHESAHPVPAAEQFGDERATQITEPPVTNTLRLRSRALGPRSGPA